LLLALNKIHNSENLGTIY